MAIFAPLPLPDPELERDREYRDLSRHWETHIDEALLRLIVSGSAGTDRRAIHQAISEQALVAFAQAFAALIHYGQGQLESRRPAMQEPEVIDAFTISLLEKTIARIRRAHAYS